jgi:hypothetical protein
MFCRHLPSDLQGEDKDCESRKRIIPVGQVDLSRSVVWQTERDRQMGGFAGLTDAAHWVLGMLCSRSLVMM